MVLKLSKLEKAVKEGERLPAVDILEMELPPVQVFKAFRNNSVSVSQRNRSEFQGN